MNGDGAGVISGSPSCSTSATAASPAGQYPVACDLGGMSAANYSLPASAAGRLTVVPESAATAYSGDTLVFTASPSATSSRT